MDNRAGKTGVGVFANLISTQADFQDRVIRLGFKQDGADVENPIVVKTDDNTELRLVNLGKPGRAVYKRGNKTVVSSTADILNIMFTEAVDNAKNQLLKEFNWEERAMSAVGVLHMLTDEAGNTIPVQFSMDLASQFSIENYFKLIDTKQDSFGQFDSQAAKTALVDVQKVSIKQLVNIGAFKTELEAMEYLANVEKKRDNVLSPKLLKDMWAVGKANAQKGEQKEKSLKLIAEDLGYKSTQDLLQKYYEVQFDSLELFYQLETVGRELMSIVGAVYTYTKGIGPNVFATTQKMHQLNKLANSVVFLDLERVAGKVSRDKDTGKLTIEPKGEIGSAIQNSLMVAQEIYGQLFPISSGTTIQSIVDELLAVTGKSVDTLGRDRYVNLHKDVFRSIIAYIYTSPDLELFLDPKQTRENLINGDSSLGKRIIDLQKDFVHKRNGFLKNIEVEKQKKGDSYTISFQNAFGTEINESLVMSGFYELAVSENPELRQLAKDLATWPYVTGDAGSLGRFIPIDYYFSDADFVRAIAEAGKTFSLAMGQEKNKKNFVQQVVQNNAEEYAAKFTFSTVGETQSSFKKVLGGKLKTSNLKNVKNFNIRLGDFEKYKNLQDSLRVPLTAMEKAQLKDAAKIDPAIMDIDFKYPDYILITDAYDSDIPGEEFRKINYLYKRTSPIYETSRIASYERVNILGYKNIKEFQVGASELKSVIKDNNNVEDELFIEQSEQVPAAAQQRNNPAGYTGHSGGANGADLTWDAEGKPYGVTFRHYYTGVKSDKNAPGGTEDISNLPVAMEGAGKVAQAAKVMWGYKYNTMKDERLIRNWAQVVNSETIFAVAPIGKQGDVWSEDRGKKDPRTLKKSEAVQGGTGYAVEMAIQAGKTVYVYNDPNAKADSHLPRGWYTWNGSRFEAIETPILTKNFAAIGSRNISDEAKQAIREVYAKTFGQPAKATSESYETVSEPYGVVVAETNPTLDKTEEFVKIIQRQIVNQAYKENIGKDANDMFMYGYRWTRKGKAKKPLNNKSYANGGLPITDAKSKDSYVYDTVDQNGQPLAPVSDLQPIIKEIENSLGRDMSNYDAVIGNIYLPGQRISTHRDTTESLSARNYPVVVYTIGNDSGITIYENEKNPGAASFASDKAKTIPTKNGTIYTFGMDGKGRFELAHDTPKGIKRDQNFPPITLPDGSVITNYTITLTFRKVADLKPGEPTAPAKIGQSAENLVADQPESQSSNVDNIYSRLGDKTQSENVVIKPWAELKDAKVALTPAGVISTRIKNSNEHFGNPYSQDPAGKTQGLIKTETVQEAVEKYIDWVINSQEPRAQWIRKQLQSGKLKGQPILYYKELGEPSHATALDYLINQYPWDNLEIEEDQEQPSNETVILYGGKNFIAEKVGPGQYNVYYTNQAGEKASVVKDASLKNKVLITHAATIYPDRVVPVIIGGKELKYYVSFSNEVYSMQPTSFGDKIVSEDVLNRVGQAFAAQQEVKGTDPEETEDMPEQAPEIKPAASAEKKIVVPKGSNPNNMVIFEDQDNKYLMNDGQQEAYTYIKNMVSQLLSARKMVTAKDLDTTVAFDNDLTRKFNGVIPQAMWNNMIGLAGRGGVGKTTVIRAIIDAITSEAGSKYKRVNAVYMAPTHTAVTVLQESLGRDSETTADDLVSTIAASTRRNRIEGKELLLASEKEYEASLRFRPAFGNPDIIIVDESSMVGAETIKDMVTRLRTDLTKGHISKLPVFIFMGDYRQLGPVNESQNPLVNKGLISSTLFMDSNKTKELTQVMRSDDQLMHQIFDAVGGQIVSNMERTQKSEKPVKLDLKKYDELTSKSTDKILVVDNEDGVVQDYAEYLTLNNNPYGMFWVHYNNVDHAKTKELSRRIRNIYMNRSGNIIEDTDYRSFSKGDYIEYTNPVESNSSSVFEYTPSTDQLFDYLNSKVSDLNLSKSQGNSFRINNGSIKPRSRFKVLDIISQKSNISEFLSKDLMRAAGLDKFEVDSEVIVLYNRQNRVRAVRKPLGLSVKFGKYNPTSKLQEGIQIIDRKTGKVLSIFSLNYGAFKQSKSELESIDSSVTMPFVPSYIGSSHTAQGNSIKNVIVGEYNIKQALTNPQINQDDVFSSLYTSITRTSGTLVIIKPRGFNMLQNQEEFKGVIGDNKERILFENASVPASSVAETPYSNNGLEGSQLISLEEELAGLIDVNEKVKTLFANELEDAQFEVSDVKAFLNRMYTSGSPFYKAVLKMIGQTGGATGLRIVVDNKMKDPASYNPTTGVIKINLDLAMDDASTADDALNNVMDELMHELVHHMTVKLLAADMTTLSPDQRKSVLALKNLFNYAKEKLMNDPTHSQQLRDALNELNNSGFMSKADKDLYYGFSSVEEFVSMMMTNRDFQEFMNNLDYQGEKTLLDRFLEVIANIIKALGIEVKDNSVLREGMNNILNLIQVRDEAELRSVRTRPEGQLEFINENFESILKVLDITKVC
jgi:nucleoside-triphosphatase THEP1